ncbi:hypothetical protein CBR_g49922 [Chara braunii]|uniref:Uncharacterized protein n=1 Tax=Chara braunii TaxID=69332 RepID=A0A388JPG8_CHABU|nr:hypothetical protein CBR_g49922 [Chara braunii]|eukprot:GBG59658.1 hypothetical protein CBR_g49922 [Chara braunii]
MEIPLLVLMKNLSENIIESPVRDLRLTIGLGMVRRGEADLGVVNLVEPSPEAAGKARVTVRYDAQRHKLDGMLDVAHRGVSAYENDNGKTPWYSRMRSQTAGSRGREVEMEAIEIGGGSCSRKRSSASGQGGSSCKRSIMFTVKKVTSSCRMKWANYRGEVTVIVGDGVGTEGSGGGVSGRGVAVVPIKVVCPGEGGKGELEALGYRESRILQVVVNDLAEVEVVVVVTLRQQRGNNVLLTILERGEAVRELAALLRGTAGTTMERGTTLKSVVRGGGSVTNTLRLGGGSGLTTGPHSLMGPGGLVSLRGRCEVIPP